MQTEGLLLDRLERLRRRVRVHLVLYGLCSVAGGGILSFLTVVTLDWLLWLPPAIRILGGTLFLLGFLLATWHWVVRPWKEPLTLEQIAGKVERHFGTFGDRLNSAVHFLRKATPGSAELMDQVVRRADEAVGQVDLNGVLTLRPLLARASLLVAGVVVLLSLAISIGWWPAIGLHRYVFPLSELRWPRTVEIDRSTPGRRLFVPVGESLVLNLRITQGMDQDLRAVAYMRNESGDVTARIMNRLDESHFVAVIEALSSNQELWFEVGDDSTADTPVRVESVNRPAAEEVLALVHPPAYVGRAESHVMDLNAGSLTATRGSTLDFQVVCNKPMSDRSDGLASAELCFDNGELLVLTPESDDPRRLTAAFSLDEERVVRINLLDRHGFANEGGREYRLKPTQDQPPRVVVEEPKAVTEITPEGKVSLTAHAEDDFGINSLWLSARNLSHEDEMKLPLSESMTEQRYEDRAAVQAEYDWSLTGLGLTPGDVVAFYVEAVDNYVAGEVVGQRGKSSVGHLKVISVADFERQAAEELAVLSDRIRRILLEEQGLKDETHRLIQSGESPEGFQGDAKSRLTDFSGLQTRLSRQLTDLARRFRRLSHRIAGAASPGGTLAELQEEMQETAGRLGDIAAGAMTQAATDLIAAASIAEPSTMHESLRSAAAQEQSAIDGLSEILGGLNRRGGVQEIVASARTLLDRQQDLQRRTRRLGTETMGKPVADLDEEAKSKMDALQRDQERLAEEARRMTENSRKLLDELARLDPTEKAEVEKALRVVQSGAVERDMDQASAALGENRTAAATQSQKSAEATLQEMLAAFQDRRRRQLAELQKKLTQAEELVAQLLVEQQDLQSVTREAHQVHADPAVYETQAATQRRLKGNAGQLGEEMAADPETVSPGRKVREGSAVMAEAETKLIETAPEEAVQKQGRAVTHLQQALDELRAMADQAREERLKNSLALMDAQLRRLRDGEQAVQDETEALKKTVEEHGRMERAETRRAGTLSKQQDDLRTETTKVRERTTDVPVYDYVLETVVSAMGDIRDGLDRRRLDAELIAREREIVRQLDQLVTAIAETLSLPSADEFAEGETGRGSASGKSSQRPVPQVAQLIVLKTIQLDLNARTTDLAVKVDPAQATEEQLQSFRKLGREQQWLRELTVKVTEDARSGGDGP